MIVTRSQWERMVSLKVELGELMLEISDNERRHATIQEVTSYAVRFFQVSEEDVKSPSRKAELVACRNFVSLYCRDYLDVSTTQLGKYFGRDHSTFVIANNRFREVLEVDKQLAKRYNEFQIELS